MFPKARTLILSAIVLSALAAKPVQAVVLYDEQFVGTGNLSGTTPETSFNSAVWLAGNSLIKADGTATVVDASSASQVTLNLGASYFANNPSIYSLSLDVTPGTSTSASWIALGFMVQSSAGASFTNTTAAGSGGIPWVMVRGNGQVNVYKGAGTNNQIVTNSPTTDTTLTLQLILDTRNATTWVLDVLVDGVSYDLNGASAGTSTTLAANTAGIVGIGTGFSGSGGSFTMDNFRLESIPEPGTAALAGLALGAAIVARRRRRA